MYHNGKSEEAVRKALVECHPRDSFTVAAKFPPFLLMAEEEIEPISASQLERLGGGLCRLLPPPQPSGRPL